jgi:hypothetical protein
MQLMSFRLPDIGHAASETLPLWQDSPYICALADAERHFGHIVKKEKWHAYDAIHSNPAATGFRELGRFADLETAKQAVQSAVSWAYSPKVMAAGAGMSHRSESSPFDGRQTMANGAA